MKCVSCKKEIEVLDAENNWISGAEGIIVAWYGSKHDETRFRVAVCDNCLDTDAVENLGDLDTRPFYSGISPFLK